MRYVTTEYPAFLGRVDKFTYGGEDIAVAFALKKHAGVAVLNVGCYYQHSPLKYRKLHSKGEDWVHWPLSTTPAAFHKFKDADELRTFFGCALYDARGRPRPAPRALFASLNRTCDDRWSRDAASASDDVVETEVSDGGWIEISR